MASRIEKDSFKLYLTSDELNLIFIHQKHDRESTKTMQHMVTLKSFANQVKLLIGKISYKELMENNPSGESLHWLFSPKALLESESIRWWTFYNHFFIPTLNHYFHQDRMLFKQLVYIFYGVYRDNKGNHLGYWAQELALNFTGSLSDLVNYFSEPEKSDLISAIKYEIGKELEIQ
jgi:hypothetical protein